jgi:hypothetical protein
LPRWGSRVRIPSSAPDETPGQDSSSALLRMPRTDPVVPGSRFGPASDLICPGPSRALVAHGPARRLPPPSPVRLPRTAPRRPDPPSGPTCGRGGRRRPSCPGGRVGEARPRVPKPFEPDGGDPCRPACPPPLPPKSVRPGLGIRLGLEAGVGVKTSRGSPEGTSPGTGRFRWGRPNSAPIGPMGPADGTPVDELLVQGLSQALLEN